MLGWLGLGNSSGGLPYDSGESIPFGGGAEHWTLCEGTNKENKDIVTLFRFNKADKALGAKLPLAKQGWAKIRTIKHPGILNFINGMESDDSIILVTEIALPLEVWAKQQQDTKSAITVDEIIWGCKCVLEALQFIHTKCNFIHGFISPHSIFVCKNGDWKLGLLDLASNLNNNDELQLFKSFEYLQPNPYRSPERKAGNWEARHYTAMDVYSLSHTIQYCFQALDVDVPAMLEQHMKKMVSAEPSRRPVCNAVLRCALFSSEYTKILELLTEISMKTPQESVDLMVTITKAEVMPRSACQHKVLPFVGRNLLIAVNDFQNRDCREACRSLASTALNLLETFINKDFIEENMFSKHIVPSVVQLWGLSDRVVRTSLLKTLKSLVIVTPADIVNKKIFDPMLAGFADSNPKMREETLKSLVHVVDKLEEKHLQDKLIRCITNLQNDQEASIRTNATIFLGKVSPKLKESVRHRVLSTSFTKAMRDSFLHCRVAGLKAAISCIAYFEKSQICKYLLPQASCLLMDPSSDVRELTLQFIEDCLGIMRTYHQTMKDEALSNASKQVLDRSIEKLDSSGSSSVSSINSWTSWAVGGLAKTTSDKSSEINQPIENGSVDRTTLSKDSSKGDNFIVQSNTAINDSKDNNKTSVVKKMSLESDNNDNWDDMDDLDIDDDNIQNAGKGNDISRSTSFRGCEYSDTMNDNLKESQGWNDDAEISWSDDESSDIQNTESTTMVKESQTKIPQTISTPIKSSTAGSKLGNGTAEKAKKAVKTPIVKLKADDDDNWDF